MDVYISCLEEDYSYKSAITGHEFENEWFKLEKDDAVTLRVRIKKAMPGTGSAQSLSLEMSAFLAYRMRC
jgi:hypothetical protein